MKGQVIMLNFWASWCGPCRQEMPILEQLNNKYQKLGFAVWGVNVDEDPALAEKLLKETGVTFPILLDSKSQVSELAQHLDAQVESFRNRRLDAEAYPHVCLDAIYVKIL